MYLRIVLACVVTSVLASQPLAQTPPPQPQPPAAQPPATQPPAAQPAAPAAPSEQLLTTAQLDALVAPIALYPDTLLAQVLMASTYPLEVVQADRWVTANKKLKGDQLKAAAEKQSWDTSVKSLVATPSVLEMMSKNLDWTQKLGDAVLAQQPDVMDGIQRMRTRAYDGKKLSSGSQQTVTVRQESGRQVIAIEPTSPDTVYVPYYDPAVVYGSWPYPADPPYYFPGTGYIAAGVVATGLAFGTGYALGRWSTGGYWGGNVNWGNNNINIDRNRVTHWEHNPQHRGGVQYRNNAVQQRFGNTNVNNIRAGSADRMDFRGRGGDQVLRPGGDRPGGGDIRNAARPEQRPADRAGAAGRQDRGQGQRANAGARQERAGNRPGGGREAGRGGGAPRAATRPSGGGRQGAFNTQAGRAAGFQSQRGQASFAHSRAGGGPAMRGGGFGGGGARMGGGGGRMGGGGGRGGGGRRSDIQLKNHIELLGRLSNGIGFYRFEYNGSPTSYVGVIAQEVQVVIPQAVSRGADGYLRVDYRQLGVPFQTFARWQASGGRIPGGGHWH